MLADISLIQKLWNKGVDISAAIVASVVSAMIIAVIAHLFYKVKRSRDLAYAEDLQRQQDRIGRELQTPRDEAERRSKHVKLQKEIESLAQQALTYKDDPGKQEMLYHQYVEFLKTRGVVHLPGNVRALAENSAWASGLRYTQPMNYEGAAKRLERVIRETELPHE